LRGKWRFHEFLFELFQRRHLDAEIPFQVAFHSKEEAQGALAGAIFLSRESCIVLLPEFCCVIHGERAAHPDFREISGKARC